MKPFAKIPCTVVSVAWHEQYNCAMIVSASIVLSQVLAVFTIHYSQCAREVTCGSRISLCSRSSTVLHRHLTYNQGMIVLRE